MFISCQTTFQNHFGILGFKETAMALVELQNVVKHYPLGKTEVEALKGISFSLKTGEFLSIAGPSGSGKSTLLNIIGCIDVPTSGAVMLNGKVTSDLGDREITRLRHEAIGFIFQSFNLIPVLSVEENVEFPFLLGPTRGEYESKEKRSEWVNYLIEEVGLTAWKKHKPNELSGGQRQRVAIARALVTRPTIVLADEPTANLDSTTGSNIIELMKRINRELSTTFIFSTHDRKIVNAADRVITLKDGLIESDEGRKAPPEASPCW